MKIVVLERNSVGTDIDISCYEELGEVTVYPNTEVDKIAEWVKEAEEAKQLPNQRRATTKHLQKPNKK